MTAYSLLIVYSYFLTNSYPFFINFTCHKVFHTIFVPVTWHFQSQNISSPYSKVIGAESDATRSDNPARLCRVVHGLKTALTYVCWKLKCFLSCLSYFGGSEWLQNKFVVWLWHPRVCKWPRYLKTLMQIALKKS